MRRLVNRTGNQFLASTGFACDQNRLGVPGNAVHHADEFVHQRTGDNESVSPQSRGKLCA